MSVQRKRWPTQIVAYREAVTTDKRGNIVRRPAERLPGTLPAVVLPERSSRAEVPGQRAIDVRTLLVDPGMEGVTLWTRVEFDGKEWDVVTPPMLRRGGSRRTRHWTFDVRARGSGSKEAVDG